MVGVWRIWWKPATLTSTSSLPNAATQSATACAHAAGVVMSTDAYLPPGTSANTSAIRSASRAIPNTEAPRSANSLAVAAPSPADVPVISATFPFSAVMDGPSHAADGPPASRRESREFAEGHCDTQAMTIARVLAVAAAFASVVLGFASPARADQLMQGIYTYTQGDVVAEWTIYPTCVPTVGDLRDNLELPVACTLHVAPPR